MKKLDIPFDGINHMDEDYFEIILNDEKQKVVYFSDVDCWFKLVKMDNEYIVELPVWRKDDGTWVEGSITTFPKRPIHKKGKIKHFDLPQIPVISKKLHKIPTYIHYIWIGSGKIPDTFVSNIEKNIRNCPHYTHV